MPVTARDRAHFERIAQAKRDESDERLREAIAQPAMQRIIQGLEMGDAALTDATVEAMLDARALGQAELAARARRLGLIR